MIISPVYGQIYPPQVTVNSVNWGTYQSPQSIPSYLQSFTDAVTNSSITRISDEGVFGCDCSKLRHRYAKNQPWNADGTLIMTSGSPSKILDGNTYQVLYESTTKALWSNVNPHLTFDAEGGATFVKKNIITGVTTNLHIFSEYSAISVGNEEGNLSNDDRYVALIGFSGSNKTVIVYDILNDVIVSTKSLGTADIDWVSVSQSGNYVVVSGYSDGSGPLQGIKAYDKFMNNETHLYNGRAHGDIGYDTQGNEVYVAYEGISGYALSYARLDNAVKQGLFPYTGATGDRGLWGGHISTRNLNRPGWAYVSDQGHPTDINRYEATREIFAIKLDASQTIERFAKHNSNLDATSAYNHQAQVVPNRDGSKVLFASNWDIASLKNNNYPLMWVAEANSTSTSITANAGADVSICRGESTTLTASGGATYQWSTGATTASITVNPNTTTTYTLTAYDATGINSDTDDVIVTVNTPPTANAGVDVSICLGTSVTLTASGGSSYLWSNGAITQSINVNPNTTSTYSVEVTQNGCSSTDDVTVTVNPMPTINAGNDVTIFSGESATLSATGGTSYIWSNGATTQVITVSPTVTTTYTVIGIANGCENIDSVTVFFVDDGVAVNAGADTEMCQGESVTLTASGGATYQWSTGATTASITVNPTTTTTYTVTAYSASGNNSDTDDVTVTVNPLPTINAGNDVTIDLGQSVTLTATGGSSYVWNTGATTTSITVNPTSTTTYNVIGATNGCEGTDTVTVTVLTGDTVTANAGQDATICQGESVTLTASGGATYQWSTGATTAGITVNPNTTTTYTVTAYDSSGINSDNDDVTVTVNPLPTINAGNDVTIDLGQSVTLTATGGTSYVWNTGAATTSITVNPSSTTTYTVVGASSGCEGTDTVTVTINGDTVNANAGENRTICIGYNVVLTASGGESYLWSTGETTQSITVTPNSTTTYSVTVFSGVAQDTDEVTVMVNPNPVVNIVNGTEVTILEGEFVTLSASGANTYLWNNGATQPNIAVSPTGTTTYSVTGYINNCTDVKDVTVNVIPEVNAFAGNDQTICLDESITLIASGGEEFLWNTGETTSSINVSPTEDSTFSVTVYNDLDYDTAEVMVFVNDCSVLQTPEEPEVIELSVYPNPTSGKLHIKFSGLLKVSSIFIYDLSGKKIFEESVSNNEQLGFEKTLDLSKYSDGLYILQLVNDGKSMTKKIVLSR